MSQNNPDDNEEDNGKSFDWKSHVALCIEPAPEHPVYGMTFTEFLNYRGKYWGEYGKEKTGLGFRLPPEITDWIPRLARRHHMHATRYIGLALELGLITFQKDYNDSYHAINTRLDTMFYAVGDSTERLSKLGQISKQTIKLGSATRENKLYNPTIAEEIVDAVTGTASEINCTKSDLVFVCVCLGIRSDYNEKQLPGAFMAFVSSTIAKFESELEELDMRTLEMYNKISNQKTHA